MSRDYAQRDRVVPPHVSIRSLRHVSRMTLDEVCSRVNEVNPKLSLTRGGLSGIENGHRGASPAIIAALELVYDLEAGAIDTQYEPRGRAA